MSGDYATTDDVHVPACVECPRVSSASGRGWKACWIDDPYEHEPPALPF